MRIETFDKKNKKHKTFLTSSPVLSLRFMRPSRNDTCSTVEFGITSTPSETLEKLVLIVIVKVMVAKYLWLRVSLREIPLAMHDGHGKNNS